MEWVFLENIMAKMGFPDSGISLVMRCVSTVSYSTLINEQPSSCFYPSRGLFLFLFIFDVCRGLSTFTRKTKASSDFQGMKIYRQPPTLSHLFFADDSVLFARVWVQESASLKQLLHHYERASR